MATLDERRMTESGDYRQLSRRKVLSTFVAWAIVMLLVAVIVGVLSTPAVVSRPASHRTMCLNNVRNIGLALLNYALTNPGNVFPPANIADQTGIAHHSWRVAIVGFLDQPAFIRKYHWDEPWNGPRNARLANELTVSGFHCPDDPDNSSNTSYVVVVGPHTLFPGTLPRGLKDIKRAGGAADTILVVELPQSGVHWMEPRDLKYEDAARGLDISGEPIVSVHPPTTWEAATINVCFADGHAQPIAIDQFADFIKQHARIDDEPVSLPGDSRP
jgi:prepilin-type processing-associated H-X9-DG protein